jgi:hypothetical protein
MNVIVQQVRLNLEVVSSVSKLQPYSFCFFSTTKRCPPETIIRFRVLIPSVSNMTNNSSDKTSKYAGQWADLLADLFDKLTGKEAEVTYTFDNLEINVPEAVGPDGKTLGSAKWTINGKILIKAEAHRTA